MDLHGKTALVTGAAKRLGRACALALASQGTNVVIHYNASAEEAETVAETCRSSGARAWIVQTDLAEPDEVVDLFELITENWGPLDVLINNASVFEPGRIADLALEELARNVRVNAFAPLALARALAAQKRPGAVVNFLDCRIVGGDPDHAAYHLSKRMLFTITRMLALELAPEVRVNAVAPGLILPPTGEDDGYLRRLAHTNPLNRHGSEKDVTDAVLYLLHSDFVTGQVLYVDGGRHMKGRVYGG